MKAHYFHLNCHFCTDERVCVVETFFNSFFLKEGGRPRKQPPFLLVVTFSNGILALAWTRATRSACDGAPKACSCRRELDGRESAGVEGRAKLLGTRRGGSSRRIFSRPWGKRTPRIAESLTKKNIRDLVFIY